MVVIRAALRLFPFDAIYRWLTRLQTPNAKRVSLDEGQVALIARSIRRANRVLGWRDDCLPQALAARLLLRRRGLHVRLRIGVKKGPGGRIQAHAWVEHDGMIVVGGTGPDLHSFTPLRDLDGVFP